MISEWSNSSNSGCRMLGCEICPGAVIRTPGSMSGAEETGSDAGSRGTGEVAGYR